MRGSVRGNNTYCHIDDIKSQLLFCLDPDENKAFYTESASSLTETLGEHCYCEGATENGAPNDIECPMTSSTTIPTTPNPETMASNNSTDTPNTPAIDPGPRPSEKLDHTGTIAVAITVPVVCLGCAGVTTAACLKYKCRKTYRVEQTDLELK